MEAPAGTRFRSLLSGEGLPDPDPLPRYVAPLPRWLENVGLRLAWPVVAINLAGTAFGFWFYRYQFSVTPTAIWPVVPDSPMATLFIALSLAAWKLGRPSEYLNTLAFFGCLKLGAWTPFVLLVFADAFRAVTPLPLYAFLVVSHLAMVVEAFLLHRYSRFPVRAVALAAGWYAFNDVVDYFVPLVGDLHHTLIASELIAGGYDHSLPAHDIAAAGAVVLTVAATFLALVTRVKQVERGAA